jgi:hypothetical protein
MFPIFPFGFSWLFCQARSIYNPPQIDVKEAGEADGKSIYLVDTPRHLMIG